MPGHRLPKCRRCREGLREAGHDSSGAKERQVGIGYLRRLLVVGATAVLRTARQRGGGAWIMRLLKRQEPKAAAVAPADAGTNHADHEAVFGAVGVLHPRRLHLGPPRVSLGMKSVGKLETRTSDFIGGEGKRRPP